MGLQCSLTCFLHGTPCGSCTFCPSTGLDTTYASLTTCHGAPICSCCCGPSMFQPLLHLIQTPHTSSRSRRRLLSAPQRVHMWSAKMCDVHASVSKVFGKILSDRECTPVNAFWPPILWSPLFRADPASSFIDEARNLRSEWLEHFRNRDGFEPRTIFLCASRWANEKRILEIFPCIPEDCGLVIVGDGTSMYSDQVATSPAEPP